MKFKFIIPLLLEAFIFTSCNKGTTSSVISEEEFYKRASEVTTQGVTVTKITSRGKIEQTSTEQGKQTTSMDADITQADLAHLTTQQQGIINVITQITFDWVKDYYENINKKLPTPINLSYAITDDYFKLTAQYNQTQSVPGSSLTQVLDGEYVWNRYGMITKAYEVFDRTLSVQGSQTQHTGSLMDFTVDYDIKVVEVPVGSKVTKEQYQIALAPSSFTNCTFIVSGDGITETLKQDGMKAYSVYTMDERTYESWLDASVNPAIEYHYENGVLVSQEVKNPTMPSVMYTTVFSVVDFDSLHFDEATGSYVGTNVQSTGGVFTTLSLKFSDGKLVYAYATTIEQGVTVVAAVTYQDYGTTVVNIPQR